MAINESQKVDWLWKKLGYGVAKTDVNSVKAATNESIASPLLIRGDIIWQDAASIPTNKPAATTTVVGIYDDSGFGTATVETTQDATATPNRTWKTNQDDWISSEFGSTYQVKVYLDNTGAAAPQTTGTQLFAAGSGNNDEWFFDYQSGVLNFIGDNLPGGISGKKIYVVGARYVGNKGGNQTSANIANFTFNGNTIGISNLNGDIILDPNGTGNLTVITDNMIIDGSGALVIPVGTTAQRPTPNAQGMIRYNTTDATFEGFDGANWGSLGGVKDVDGDTYIVAETGAGTDNDQLDFYTAGTQRFQIGATGDFKFGDTLTEVTIAGATGDTVIGGTLDAGNSTLSSAIVSDLTDNRIVIAGTAGLLEDDANFTFDGTELAVGVTNFTVAQATGNVYTAGNFVIAGDLQIDGTTTTINSTTVSVDDLNLTLASGAANASAANGAGITIDGASATFTYVSGSDRWTMNKDLATDLVGNVTGNVSGSAGTVTSLSNRSVGDLSDVDITTTAPTNNQALVWDNANGKFIPGDSFSQSDFDTAFTSKDTDDLSEGTTNLYYTNARADARISAADTDDLSEGLTNLYYTDARFDTRFTAKSTTNLSEGTNLYYTNARADARIAAASIDDLTDVDITTAAPTNNQALIWDNANSKFIPGDSFSQSDFDTAFAAKNIGGLNDVNTTGVANGEILKYVSASSEFQTSLITNSMLDPTNVFADQFTANGSTAAFTLSSDPGSKNAIQVFVDGVPQLASNYTVVGTTLTLGGTPTNGQIVEVRGYGTALPVGTVADASITGVKLQDGTITADKISSAAYASQTFTGDNSTTAFTLNNDPGTAQALLVMVENVIQEPIENYTTSGTTLTFTGVPVLNARIYVRYLGLPLNNTTPPNNSVTNAKLNLTYTSNQYTGNNTTTAYTIQAGHNAHSLLVILDGSILPPSDYSISGSTLTFAAAPLLNQSIDIRYMPV